MTLFALGLNHRTAPIKVREQVVFTLDTLGQALADLLGQKRVKEAAILSTCNRTEVYCHGADAKPVADWLADYHRLAPSSLSPHLYTLPEEQAVRHAFRVASGLDSMVIGEPQILGQRRFRGDRDGAVIRHAGCLPSPSFVAIGDAAPPVNPPARGNIARRRTLTWR